MTTATLRIALFSASRPLPVCARFSAKFLINLYLSEYQSDVQSSSTMQAFIVEARLEYRRKAVASSAKSRRPIAEKAMPYRRKGDAAWARIRLHTVQMARSSCLYA